MFCKKDPIRIISTPNEINLSLEDAWSQLLSQYDFLRAQAEGGWNKTHFLGVLNCFFVQHRELSERFPHDYGKWEEPLVETAFANAKEGRPTPPSRETDFSGLDGMGDKAACWKELLNTYCRIHGFLKVEWRAWNDNEYREFLATIDKLRSSLALTNPDRGSLGAAPNYCTFSVFPSYLKGSWMYFWAIS